MCFLRDTDSAFDISIGGSRRDADTDTQILEWAETFSTVDRPILFSGWIRQRYGRATMFIELIECETKNDEHFSVDFITDLLRIDDIRKADVFDASPKHLIVSF